MSPASAGRRSSRRSSLPSAEDGSWVERDAVEIEHGDSRAAGGRSSRRRSGPRTSHASPAAARGPRSSRARVARRATRRLRGASAPRTPIRRGESATRPNSSSMFSDTSTGSGAFANGASVRSELRKRCPARTPRMWPARRCEGWEQLPGRLGVTRHPSPHERLHHLAPGVGRVVPPSSRLRRSPRRPARAGRECEHA